MYVDASREARLIKHRLSVVSTDTSLAETIYHELVAIPDRQRPARGVLFFKINMLLNKAKL